MWNVHKFINVLNLITLVVDACCNFYNTNQISKGMDNEKVNREKIINIT